MFGALRQYQYLSILAIGVFDLGGNRVRSGLVGGKVTEYPESTPPETNQSACGMYAASQPDRAAHPWA